MADPRTLHSEAKIAILDLCIPTLRRLVNLNAKGSCKCWAG